MTSDYTTVTETWGLPASPEQLAFCVPCYVAETDEQARREAEPHLLWLFRTGLKTGPFGMPVTILLGGMLAAYNGVAALAIRRNAVPRFGRPMAGSHCACLRPSPRVAPAKPRLRPVRRLHPPRSQG